MSFNMTMTDDVMHADEAASSKPWADIVLACFLINLVTLSGIVLTAVTRFCVVRKHKTLIETLIVPSFAAGALLATAAFLLVPESLELLIEASHSAHEEEEAHRFRYLEEDHADHEGEEVHAEEEESHEGEGAFAWKFGAAILGGFLLPLLLHALIPRAQDVVEECEACQQDEIDPMLSAAARNMVEDNDDTATAQDETAKLSETKAEDLKTMESGCDAQECQHKHHHAPDDLGVVKEAEEETTEQAPADTTVAAHTPINLPLTFSILLGDAIHNFTDGVFLANAFLLCSRDIAWTMVATTIYHELAQELADYLVLTSHCGLPVWKALLLNFLSGLSVLLGAIVILVADMSNEATGVILAVSAGVYLYITAVECVPRVLDFVKGQRKLFLVFLLTFVVGAVPIGLVLLNHGHCGSE